MILMVSEDVPGIRAALLHQGYRVLSVPDALAGLQAVIALDIALVMVDIRLARARRIDIIPQMHKVKPGLPIVMLTTSPRTARRSSVNLVYLLKDSPEIPGRVKQLLAIRKS